MSFSPIRIGAHNPGPMTGAGTNTYLIVGPTGESTLIDAGAGVPEHLAAIRNHLDEHDARLVRVLVTHGHSDHVAGAPALAAAHPGTRFHKYPWPAEDARYPVQWTPLVDDEVLEAGDESLQVLHTAGHSPDHVVFWHERSRTAFTGDLVIAGSSVMIDRSRGGDLDGYLHALEHLLALRPRLLLPGHGPEVRDPHAVLSEHLAHRHMRERQVIAAMAAGCETVQAILESIYDGLAPALWPAARENIRAHLEKLEREGRATGEHDRWRLGAT